MNHIPKKRPGRGGTATPMWRDHGIRTGHATVIGQTAHALTGTGQGMAALRPACASPAIALTVLGQGVKRGAKRV